MYPRVFKTIFVFTALLGIAVHAATGTAAKEEKHSDPTRSCVSAECHADVVKHKYLHGPLVIGIGQCTVCHMPLPGPDHKFRTQQNDAVLCGDCHNPVNTEKFLHDPVSKGKCLDCHDPHGSEAPSMIRISPLAKLCDDCHDPVATKKYTHDPVAKGECLDCHPAHGSKEPKLLNASGRALCFECHDELRPGAAGSREIHLAKEDCAGCHRPHESVYSDLLTGKPLDLCFGCHDDLKERMESEEFKHEAVTDGMACVECHKAHISQLDALLREPSGDLCYDCHDDLKARVDAAEFRHKPVEDNDCGSCHLPHSSRYADLLLAESPTGGYASYDPARYALCFSCHEEGLAGERYTETLTDFRNGDLNLHYLHVNKEVNGRTCSSCHEAHAGSHPKLIRDEALYGNWRVPIQFTKTETGGSCSAGCHEEYAYDRVNPVQLKEQ
jgi:predicted CXXCH cytochrome family protein